MLITPLQILVVCSGLDIAGVKRSAHTFAVLITPLQMPVVCSGLDIAGVKRSVHTFAVLITPDTCGLFWVRHCRC